MLKILVPIDGSENATRAAHHAIKIARQCENIEIYLVTVVYHFSSSRAGTDLEKARNLFITAGIDIITKILEGDPGDTIIRYVNQQGIDAVVMGSRGRGAIQGIVLGSVSNKVLAQSPVPVTIVK